MPLKIYGEPVTCDECGSDNMVERYRRDHHGADYPVGVCRTCGWERGL